MAKKKAKKKSVKRHSPGKSSGKRPVKKVSKKPAQKRQVKKQAVHKAVEDPLSKELRELERLRVRPEKEHAEEPVKQHLSFHKEPSGFPAWFYIGSIFAAFLFTAYISIFAAIHFEDIRLMNITIIFFFISMVSFFLVSAAYFISEKRQQHSYAPIVFFVGIAAIMTYAFKAVDTSNLVRFSIIYTIIVAAASTYILIAKKQ